MSPFKKIIIITSIVFSILLLLILYLELITIITVLGILFYIILFMIMFSIIYVTSLYDEKDKVDEVKNKTSLSYCWNRINFHLNEMEGMTLTWGKGTGNQTAVKAYNNGKEQIYFRAIIAKIASLNTDILVIYNTNKDEIARYEKPKTVQYSDLFYDFKPFEGGGSGMFNDFNRNRYPYNSQYYNRPRYIPPNDMGGFDNDSTTDFSDNINTNNE